MSEGGTLRIHDLGAYLGVSHQRADQICAEGKLPEPDQVDGVGPLMEAGHDRALG